MGTGATSTNVPQNQFTQQSAQQGYNSVQGFGQMPNYALGANNAYTPNVYENNYFSPTTFTPQSLVDTGNNISSQGSNLYGAANTAWNTASDPMMQQYDFYNQKFEDAMRAEQAASGTAMSPAGAGVFNQGEADFANQWAMNQSARENAALSSMTGAYGQGANMQSTGAGLAAAGPAFQSQELSSLLSALSQNYVQPQQNVSNQLGYMSAANSQNATAVQSAQQQNQAALMNSPLAFLGALGGAFTPKMTYSLNQPLA